MRSVDGLARNGTECCGNGFASLFGGLEMSSGGLVRFPVGDMISCHAVLCDVCWGNGLGSNGLESNGLKRCFVCPF